MRYILLFALFFTFFIPKSNAQNYNYVDGALEINVFASNPCDGSNNGYLTFEVVSANGGSASIVLFKDTAFEFASPSVNVGSTWEYDFTRTLGGATYDFIINDGTVAINTFVSNDPVVLVLLPDLGITSASTDNTDCNSPDGQVSASVTGGSQDYDLLVNGEGSYTYTWSSDNGLAGLPLSGTFDGESTLDLATLLGVGGLPGGTYTIKFEDDYSLCEIEESIVLTDPSPNDYTITTATPYIVCNDIADPNRDVLIDLAGSDAGVNYTIHVNGTADNSTTEVGTGAALQLTLPFGSYADGDPLTVVAVDGFCTPRTMDGGKQVEVDVVDPPNTGLAVSLVDASICEGDGTNVQIELSEVGKTYQLRNDADDSNIGFAIAGTGGTILLPTGTGFTSADSPVTFNVLASVNGCSDAELLATPTLTIDPAQDLTLTVTPDPATICEGETANILVDNTEIGVNYQLREDLTDTPIGTPVAGTGGTISLPAGVLTTTTIFNILSERGTCSLELDNKATVIVNPSPDISLTVVAQDDPICENTGTNILVISSQNGVSYQLRNDLDDSAVGVPVAGDGGDISLPTGNLTTSTTFNVLAISGVCSVELTNQVTITVDPAPDLTLAVSDGAICNPAVADIIITVSGAELGYTYEIQPLGGGVAIGTGVGAGADLDITIAQADLPATTTTYQVVVVTGTACGDVTLTDQPTITVTDLPDNSLAVSDADICNPAAGDASITITGAEAGVTYEIQPLGGGAAIASGLGAGADLNITILQADLPTVTTTYQVVAIAPGGACADVILTDQPTITVSDSPDASLAVSDASICNPAGGDAIITITGAEAGFTYEIQPVGGGVAIGTGLGAGADLDITIPLANLPTTTTTYDVVVISGTVCGNITLTDQPTITVTDAPDNSLAVSDAAICNPAEADAIITITGAEVGITYEIQPLGGGAAIATGLGAGADLDITIAQASLPTVTTSYQVVAVSGGVCADVILVDQPTITVTDQPDNSLAVSDADICNPAEADATITITGAEAGITYEIQPLGGGAAIGTGIGAGADLDITIAQANLPAVTTTYQIVAIIGGGCSDVVLTDQPTITVTDAPDANLAVSDAGICNPALADAILTITGAQVGVTYEIQPLGGGAAIGTGLGAGVDLDITILQADLPTVTTTYQVVAISSGACSDVVLLDQPTITVTDQPDNTLAVSDADICNPAAGDAIITITGAETGVTYEIQPIGGGAAIGTGVGAGADLDITIAQANLPTVTTSYQVVAISGACSDVTLTDQPTITVTDAPDNTLAVSDADICNPAGGDAIITITGAETGITYEIQPLGGGAAIGTGIGAGADLNITILLADLPTVTTTYQVVAISGGACGTITLTDQPIITVFDAPDNSLAVSDAAICNPAGGDAIITITGAETGITYEIQPLGGGAAIGTGLGAGADLDITIAQANLPTSTTTYQVVAMSGGICADVTLTNQPTITVTDAPDDGLAVSDIAICNPALGDEIITITGAEAGVVYEIEPLGGGTVIGTGTGTGADLNITIIQANLPAVTTTYQVVAIPPNVTCSPLLLLDQPVINVADQADENLAVSDADVCNPSAGDAIITVTGAEAGVTYEIQPLGGGAAIATGVGAGADLDITVAQANLPAVTTTYQVVAITGGACADVTLLDQPTITVNDAPTDAVISTTTPTICEGDNGVISVTTGNPAGVYNIVYSDGVNPNVTILAYNDGDAINVTPAAGATIYTLVSIEDNATSCVGTIFTANVLINATAAPNSGISTDPTLCSTEGAFLLTNALSGGFDAGGVWTDTGGNAGGAFDGTNFDPSVAGVGNYEFTYTVTGTAPCPDAATVVTVTVVTGFDAGLDNTIQECSSNTNVDLFNALGGTPQTGGVWTDDDASGGNLDTNLGILDLTGVTAGDYNFTYTLSGGGCATSTATITVQVSEEAVVVAGNYGDICSGDAIALTGASVTNGTNTIWSAAPIAAGTFTDATAINTTFTPAVGFSGTVVLTLTADGIGLCAGSSDDTNTITINEAVEVDPGTYADICEGDDISLTGATVTAGTAATFAWSEIGTTQGSFSDAAVLNPVFTPGADAIAAGFVTLEITITDASGLCSDTEQVTININATPNSGIAVPATACLADNAFVLFSALDGSQSIPGTWAQVSAFGGTLDATTGEWDITTSTAADADIAEFTYTVAASGSCPASTTTVFINITAALDAGTGNTVQACEGDNAFDLFTGLTGPQLGGVWTNNDGGGILNAATGEVDYSDGTAAGTYTYTYTVSGAGCADATAVVTVELNATPNSGTPVSATPTTICDTETAFDLFTLLTGQDNNLGTWTDDDATGGLTGNLLDATGLNGVFNFTYEIDNSGCTASTTVQVNVTDNVVASVSIADTNNPACAGDDVVLTATPVDGGATPTYQWYIDIGIGIPIGGATTDPSLTVGATDGDVYYVEMTSSLGCAAAGPVESNKITINTVASVDPSITASAVTTDICLGEEAVFNVDAITGGGLVPTYQWQIDGADVVGETGTEFRTTTLPNGPSAITVIMTSNASCATAPTATSNTINVNVSNAVTPTAVITGPTTGCLGAEVVFDATVTNQGATPTYQWIVDGLDVPGENTIEFRTSSLSAGSHDVQFRLTSSSSCAPAGDVLSNAITIVIGGADTPVLDAITLTDCDGFTATWSPVIGTDSYNIEISTDNTFATVDVADNTTANTYTVPGLTQGTQYFMRIASVNACGTSAFSNVESATTAAGAPITPVNELITNLGCTTFDFTWDATTGASSYRVDIATDAAFTALVVTDASVATNTYSATGLTIGTDYFARVRAVNNCGTSANSGTATGTTDNSVPTAPIATVGTAIQCTSFIANWAVVGTATGYTLELSLDAGFTTIVQTVNTSDLFASLTGLTQNTNYFYRVRATNDCGASANSNVVGITTSDTGCGGTNCGAFTVNVPEAELIRPSCDGLDDGKIVFYVSGGSNHYTFTLSSASGFNKQLLGPGPFEFSDLSAEEYEYTILDNNTGDVCGPLAYTLEQQTVVAINNVQNITDSPCFDQPFGTVEVSLSGGTLPYEYSTDNGTTWLEVPNDNIIKTLPPNINPYNVYVRDNDTDLCPASFEVTVGNANTEIIVDYTTTDASCDDNDGSLTITNVAGGTGVYTYRLDGLDYPTLPAGGLFPDLAGGDHIFTVIDDTGCEKNTTILVPFPGLVDFQTAPTDASCSVLDPNDPDEVIGANGTIWVGLASPVAGTEYLVGLSTDVNFEPDFIELPFTGYTFKNLTKGTYYVTVLTEGSTCPNKEEVIIDGPDVVSFVPTVRCSNGDEKEIILTDITGATGIPYLLQVFDRNNPNFPLESIVFSLNAGNEFLVSGYNFLTVPGDYRLKLSQSQSVCGGAEFVYEYPEVVSIFEMMSAVAFSDPLLDRSLPERPSGKIYVSDFDGGVPDYEVRGELVSPTVPGQSFITDWETVTVNNNLELEYLFEDAPAGDYLIEVRDAQGCTIELSSNVALDTDLFIPNVFTPNGDGYNDTFFLRNKPDEAVELVVSNRWGRVVYSSSDYDNSWNGSDQPDGVYYYSVKVQGGESKSGWVEILRGKDQ